LADGAVAGGFIRGGLVISVGFGTEGARGVHGAKEERGVVVGVALGASADGYGAAGVAGDDDEHPSEPPEGDKKMGEAACHCESLTRGGLVWQETQLLRIFGWLFGEELAEDEGKGAKDEEADDATAGEDVHCFSRRMRG